MKKKIALLALMAIFAAIAASSTIAYFTSETTAHNVITSGGIGITLVETMNDGEPFINQTGVMPATSVSKIVKVLNDEEMSWIRVKLITSVESAGGASELDSKYVIPRFIHGEKAISLKQLEAAENSFFKWTYNAEDGYWYYTEPVENGAYTDALFHEVYFDANMGNAYQGCTVKIDVKAEAVQYANNGATVFEAAGWPN